ncbi:MAG: universal stress protein [Bacteroidota bacterium]
MNSILVPTEFTYLSRCALNLGIELAKMANAKMQVVSVIESGHNVFMQESEENSHDPYSSIANIAQTDDARKRMQERAAEISDWFPDETIYPKILYGNKVDSLILEASQNNNDLVIAGGDLYETTDQMLNELLRKSPAPVIVLKCMINGLRNFKDLILLADVEKDSKRLVEKVKVLQKILDARIHVVRVNTPLNFLKTDTCNLLLQEYVSKHNLQNVEMVHLEGKNEISGLLEFCESIANAFVCMGMYQRNFIEKLLHPDIPKEEIIANSTHPLWIYSQ